MGVSIGKSLYVSLKVIIGDFDFIMIEKNIIVDEGCNICVFEVCCGGMCLLLIFIGEGCMLCVYAVCGSGVYVLVGSIFVVFIFWREMDL